ncbi:MAG: hypothetical protein ACYC5R_11415 [Melioribacteraceae bacterium]
MNSDKLFFEKHDQKGSGNSMSVINFEIALYNSPSFEELINELYRISRYKRNIYRNIKNEDEYYKKLSYEERAILKDLSAKENNLIIEILVDKNWLNLPDETVKYFKRKLGNKLNSPSEEGFDKYENSIPV